MSVAVLTVTHRGLKIFYFSKAFLELPTKLVDAATPWTAAKSFTAKKQERNK